MNDPQEYKKITITVEDSKEVITLTAEKARNHLFEPIVRRGRDQKIWEDPDYVLFEPDQVIGLTLEFLTDLDDQNVRYRIVKQEKSSDV